MTPPASHTVHDGRAYVPTTALATSLSIDDERMHVTLMDGRVISLPLV